MTDRSYKDLWSDTGFLRSSARSAGRGDPYTGFNFLVEIEGLLAGGFSEVSGLEVDIAVQSYREGGENLFEHQLPGPASYPQRLVLKRGLTDVDALWDWQQQVARGLITRRNGTIYLLGDQHTPVMLWDFRRAYPVKWIGPEFHAGRATVGFETLELVHHGISRSKGLSLIAAAQKLNDAAKRWL